jgi:pimeloyl-ACP methyl ester carboxylesterase
MSIATLAMSAASAVAAPPEVNATVVLVHGAFVDGSGWAGVHRRLLDDGYPVIIVQNPTNSLSEDVAYTRRAIAAAVGPVVLVGHSYGGVVITEAGNDPKVSALVYVAAFAPDEGESVSSLIGNPPPGAQGPPILPPQDGYLFLDRLKFHEAFAKDVAPDLARLMADSQVPWGVQALGGKISKAAWKDKPSWFLVAQDDQVIPPDAQRNMAARAGASVRAVPGSHAVFIANPQAVVALIEEAARRRSGS